MPNTLAPFELEFVGKSVTSCRLGASHAYGSVRAGIRSQLSVKTAILEARFRLRENSLVNQGK